MMLRTRERERVLSVANRSNLGRVVLDGACSARDPGGSRPFCQAGHGTRSQRRPAKRQILYGHSGTPKRSSPKHDGLVLGCLPLQQRANADSHDSQPRGACRTVSPEQWGLVGVEGAASRLNPSLGVRSNGTHGIANQDRGHGVGFSPVAGGRGGDRPVQGARRCLHVSVQRDDQPGRLHVRRGFAHGGASQTGHFAGGLRGQREHEVFRVYGRCRAVAVGSLRDRDHRGVLADQLTTLGGGYCG